MFDLVMYILIIALVWCNIEMYLSIRNQNYL